MLYTGLCHTDVLVGRAIWGETIFPIAPGHEIIGEVSQVGSEVSDFKKGDIVGFGTIRYVMTAKTSRKIMRNFALEEEIITLMDDTGEDMQLQFSNLLISSFIYLRNLILSKALLFSALVLPLITQWKNT